MKTNRDSKIIVKNLLDDPYFHKWVINPDKACLDFWDNWVAKSEEKKACMEIARAMLLSFEFKSTTMPTQEKENLWDQISERIEQPTEEKTNGGFINSSRQWWYGIAASILLLVMAYFVYNSVRVDPIASQKTEANFIEKVAPEGKISSFTFEDGTTVKLFSGSVIRYPVTFSKDSREVYLKGEGFFEVKKDTKRPFTVKTNTSLTTALGTSFNIQTTDKESECHVSLVTGKVRVEILENLSGRVKTVFLEPGEQAVTRFDDIIKQPFNIEETISWKDGFIHLENKSFDETIHILQRWFNVDFVINNRLKIEDKLNSRTGKGTFKNQNLENILRAIGYSFEFKYEIKDDTVIINF